MNRVFGRWLGKHLILWAGLAAGAGLAEETSRFAAVFTALDRLGLPDVSSARYARVEASWNPRVADPLPHGEQTSGNAWMLDEQTAREGREPEATFVVNGADTVTLRSYDQMKPRREGSPFAAPEEALASVGRWRPARLDRDIPRMLVFLQSRAADEAGGAAFRADTDARILLFAHQVRQHGERKGADQLLAALARTSSDLQPALKKAISLVADARCEMLHRHLLADRDERRYRDGLSALLKQCGAEWESAPGARLLLKRMDERLAGPPAAPPAACPPAHRDLAVRLLALRGVRTVESGDQKDVLWLLPETWLKRAPAEHDADLAVRALGVEAIPFLLSLAEDKALTAADVEALRGPYAYGATPGPGPNQDELFFQALPRLATRGEVAQKILAQMLPTAIAGPSWSRPDGAKLLEAARVFHAEVRGSDTETLLVRFLPDSFGLRRGAREALLELARERRLPALESYLGGPLAPPQDDSSAFSHADADALANDRAGLLSEYAALRGVESRALVQAVAKLIEADAEQYKKAKNVSYGSAENDRAHAEEVRQTLRKLVAQLLALPFDAADADLLVRYAEADSPLARQFIVARLRRLPEVRMLELALDQAVASDKPASRLTTAGLCWSVIFPYPGPDAPLEGIDPTARADAWRTLIQDDRPAGGEEAGTVSDRYLRLYEAIFTRLAPPVEPRVDSRRRYTRDERPPAVAAADRVVETYGALGRDFLRTRVLARLAGRSERELQAYPWAKPGPPDQAARLKERLAAARTRGDLAALLAALPLPERVALPGILHADAALNGKLMAFANEVVSVKAPVAEWASWTGRVAGADMLRQLQAHAMDSTRAGRPVDCRLERREDFGGIEVTVKPAVREDAVSGQPSWWGGPRYTNGIEGVSGLACADGVYGAARWRMAPPPPERRWGDLVTSDAATTAEFERSLDEVLGAQVPAQSLALVRFLTKGMAHEDPQSP